MWNGTISTWLTEFNIEFWFGVHKMYNLSAMVKNLVDKDYIKMPAVMNAMLSVDRKDFVEASVWNMVYADEPLEIGYGQTTSAPHMIATMLELSEIRTNSNILEIGTGNGYNTSLLAYMAKKGRVTSVEFVEELWKKAKRNIEHYGFKNIELYNGDGSVGYSRNAPYDRIVVTCGAPEVPPPLFEQLSDSGILVIPVGGIYFQRLYTFTRIGDTIRKKENGGVIFVSMRGKYGIGPP